MAGNITPEMARAELARRRQLAETPSAATAAPMEASGITPEMARAELERRRTSRSEPAPEDSGGLTRNAIAGGQEGLYGTLGAPVDLVRGGMNLALRGVNAATGSDIAPIPEDSFMGSKWIAETLGGVSPELNPENVTATTTEERLARAGGQGAGYTVAPIAALGVAARAGAVTPAAEATASRLFGGSGSVGEVARNTAVGAASGVASEGAMQVTPDEYDPLAGMGGGVVGGTLASLAMGLPGAVRTIGRQVGDYLAPVTDAGRQRLAAERLQGATSDLPAAREALGNINVPLVEGSQPTTGQLVGDMGLLAAERAAAVKRPEAFRQRAADQNAARVSALGTVGQGGGSPEKVVEALRTRARAIEDEWTATASEAQDAARRSAEALGPGASPEVAGERIRSRFESDRSQAKARERELYSLVDPDGSLALSPQNAQKAARQIIAEMPKAAKPLEGEEASILGVISNWKQVVPFSELRAAQSRLTDAMRAERIANGESAAYRRMSIANAGLNGDIDRVVLGRAYQERADVANGRMSPDDTLASRLDRTPSAGSTVYTNGGRSVPVDYEVVDASTLRTSNTIDGRRDPSYPVELQPRDRTRAASDAQIRTMSRNLQPERLGPSSEAGTGAPIVGPDGIVESGNGRVLAIRQALTENGASGKAYRDYLTSQGYDTAGMREPVLIRRRRGDMSMQERARFAQEGNSASSMAMSASEQAATDATRLTPDVLKLYRGGEVNSADNRDFARAFLGSVADRGQEGAFVTGNGALSIDGAGRMKNALLSAAYDDPRLVAALTDEGDENIRAFGRALGDISGDAARLRSGIKGGDIDPAADITPALKEAAGIVQRARSENVRIADMVAQADAFNPVSEEAAHVLRLAYGDGMNGRLSRDRLSTVMRQVISEAEQQTAGARLFGEALDARALLVGARARYGSAAQVSELAGSAFDGTGNGSLRAGNGRSGSLQDRPAQLGEGGSGFEGSGAGGYAPGGRGRGVDPRILEEAPLEPNFDAAALDRLNAARSATRDRVQRFDNKTLSPIRARPSSAAPYTMPDSAVAARIFYPQAKSFDAIQQARAAMGDEALLPALSDYAVDRARRVALREDGTFDPAKLASFRRSHSDALRAVPGLDARFADAEAASVALGDVARRQRTALQETQRGELARIMSLDSPEDVSRTVGAMFQSSDGHRRLAALRGAIGDNKEALEGMRRAVADYLSSTFVGNTEAGTSGIGTMKSDGFQTFVRKNKAALRYVGFSADETDLMMRIADDLQRSNRSVTAIKNPGDANTAEKLYAAGKEGRQSLLGRFVSNLPTAAGAAGGFAIGGGLSFTGLATGAVGAAFTKALADQRLNGLQTVEDIVADALLNPARARILLATPLSKESEKHTLDMLGRMHRRAVAASAAMALNGEQEERKAPPMAPLRRDRPIASPAPVISAPPAPVRQNVGGLGGLGGVSMPAAAGYGRGGL